MLFRGPEFALAFRRDGGRVVVDISGPLDLHSAAQLRHRLVDLIDGQGNRQFVLDIRHMTGVDSVGLSVLVDAHKRLRRNAGQLVLSGAKPRVVRALADAGLDKVFTFTPAWEHPAYGDGPSTTDRRADLGLSG